MPRDSETIKELETAEAFLAKGLVKNAAGKVFQALKAFTSYLALKNAALKKAVFKITEPNTLASQLRIATTARPRWREK